MAPRRKQKQPPSEKQSAITPPSMMHSGFQQHLNTLLNSVGTILSREPDINAYQLEAVQADTTHTQSHLQTLCDFSTRQLSAATSQRLCHLLTVSRAQLPPVYREHEAAGWVLQRYVRALLDCTSAHMTFARCDHRCVSGTCLQPTLTGCADDVCYLICMRLQTTPSGDRHSHRYQGQQDQEVYSGETKDVARVPQGSKMRKVVRNEEMCMQYGDCSTTEDDDEIMLEIPANNQLVAIGNQNNDETFNVPVSRLGKQKLQDHTDCESDTKTSASGIELFAPDEEEHIEVDEKLTMSEPKTTTTTKRKHANKQKLNELRTQIDAIEQNESIMAFCRHLKTMRGAKLSVAQCTALVVQYARIQHDIEALAPRAVCAVFERLPTAATEAEVGAVDTTDTERVLELAAGVYGDLPATCSQETRVAFTLKYVRALYNCRVDAKSLYRRLDSHTQKVVRRGKRK